MPKGKSKSRSSPKFVSPGGKSMVGRQYAGPKMPGVTSNESRAVVASGRLVARARVWLGGSSLIRLSLRNITLE